MRSFIEKTEKAVFASPGGEDRRIEKRVLSPVVLTSLFICIGFLLTSVSWLSWEYHLLTLIDSRTSDLMTMGIGYVLQGTGLALFALLMRKRPDISGIAVPAAIVLHTLCLLPAILSPGLPVTLMAGFLMNLLCGMIAGSYLDALTRCVPAEKRATALGAGYSSSILASWLLSLTGGQFYYSSRVFFICLILTVLTLYLVSRLRVLPEAEKQPTSGEGMQSVEPGIDLRSQILGVGLTVLLFSIINNSSFGFPSADLVQGISVESSRLFYAAGLLVAGMVSDKSRKYGAIAALAAMVTPFILLALRDEPVSLTVFWALNYFVFGFYAIFRMIVFSDLAEKHGLLFLSGFGLMIGRLGDAIGETVCLTFRDASTALIFLTAALFVAAVFLFFRIYHPLYEPTVQAPRQMTEQERFYQFAVRHDLSSRERDMLRLVLEEKTNGEIADALSISENTVKFHVRNLLQKTGCKNRQDLIAEYMVRFTA